MSPLERLQDLEDEHRRKYAPQASMSTLKAGANPQNPLYYQDLEERAARENKTIQDVFRGDQELLSSGDFPSAACLRPEEVLHATFVRSPLAPMLKRHLDKCPYCQAIVAHSKAVESPRATAIAQELAQVPHEDSTPRPARDLRSAPSFPFMRAGMLSLSLLAAMTTVLNVWFVTRERRSRQEAVSAVQLSYEALKKARLQNEQLERKLDLVRSVAKIKEVQIESGDSPSGEPKISDLIGKLPEVGHRDTSANLLQLEELIKSYATSKPY